MGKYKKQPQNRLNPEFWNPGQAGEIARMMGLGERYIYDILARRRGVSVERAKAIEQVSRIILGFPILWTDWIQNDITEHPAFRALPDSNLTAKRQHKGS